MKNLSTLHGIAAALILACSIGAAQADELVIGQVAPITGVIADTGKDLVLGAQIYFDSVNEQGGVNGRKITHLVKDDGYKVPETVQGMKDMVANDNVIALIGSAGSAHLSAVLKEKILADAGIALVAPYTGSLALREPFADTRNIFHIRAGYVDEAEKIVDQLMALRTDKIAVFHQGDAFGNAGLDGVVAALQRRGKSIVVSASYVANSPPDAGVDEAVKKIAAADPSAVIMWSTSPYSAAFVRKIRPLARIAQFVNVSVGTQEAISKAAGPEASRGIGIAQVMPFPYSSAFHVVTEYLAALKKYGHGAKPSYTSLEEYIGAKVLVEGVRRAGPNPTREKVYKALEGMSSYDTGGFVVHFSPTSHTGSSFVEITVISANGKLIR